MALFRSLLAVAITCGVSRACLINSQLLAMGSRLLCAAVLVTLGCRSQFASGESGLPTLKSKEELYELGKSFPYYVAFSYGGGTAGGCREAGKRAEEPLAALQQEAAPRLEVEAMVFLMLDDPTFEKSLQLSSCPNLVFYRQGQNPILYDGENLGLDFNSDDILTWLSRNLVSYTKVLTDDTFEHLTQASTGATTGDWFIWFYRNNCASLAAVWEAVASRLQYSKVVAKVNLDENPKLAQRFNLTSCSSIIFFSRGKLYRYSAKVNSVHALADFAEGFYKNVPSEIVKPLPTPFDQLTDDIVQWLKTCNFTSSCCWTTIGALLAVALAAFALCRRRGSEDIPKSEESIKKQVKKKQ